MNKDLQSTGVVEQPQTPRSPQAAMLPSFGNVIANQSVYSVGRQGTVVSTQVVDYQPVKPTKTPVHPKHPLSP